MVQPSTSSWITHDDLIDLFNRFAIRRETVLEVVGPTDAPLPIIGGAATLIDALIEQIGADGTIATPIDFMDNQDPYQWHDNKTIEDGLTNFNRYRRAIRPFDPKTSVSNPYNPIAENLRLREGARISNHPCHAYVAYGKYAPLITNRQSLHLSRGEDSPTARLVEKRAKFLLLGVHLRALDALALAYYRAECAPFVVRQSKLELNGKRVWKNYVDIDADMSFFDSVESILIQQGMLKVSAIGNINCFYGSINEVVDVLTKHFELHSPLNPYRRFSESKDDSFDMSDNH